MPYYRFTSTWDHVVWASHDSAAWRKGAYSFEEQWEESLDMEKLDTAAAEALVGKKTGIYEFEVHLTLSAKEVADCTADIQAVEDEIASRIEGLLDVAGIELEDIVFKKVECDDCSD